MLNALVDTPDKLLQLKENKPLITIQPESYSNELNAIYILPRNHQKPHQKDSILLFIHGGGYWHGPMQKTLDACETLSKRLRTNTDVALITYPLAPKCQFPDNINFTEQFIKRAITNLSRQYKNIFLCGESSGANLACAILLKGNINDITGLILLSPSLDYYKQDYPSKMKQLYPNNKIRSFLAKQYLPEKIDRTHELVSPIYSKHLKCLPPLIIFTSEKDPFRDESHHFHRKVKFYGNKADIFEYELGCHNFFSYKLEPCFTMTTQHINTFIKNLV